MVEHLFKLKKDGKTVGYVKLWHWGGLLYSRDTKFDVMTNKPQLPGRIEGEGLTFHPFVTKDKNGKDVFAGDSVNAHEEIGVEHHESFEGEVYLDEETTFYRISKVRRIPIYQACCIEIIEDKENE